MSQDIHDSIDQVVRAVENLNRAFEKQVSEHQQAQNTERLNHWVKATRAMQDSGHLYLTWAKYYAGLTDPGEEEEDAYPGENLSDR